MILCKDVHALLHVISFVDWPKHVNVLLLFLEICKSCKSWLHGLSLNELTPCARPRFTKADFALAAAKATANSGAISLGVLVRHKTEVSIMHVKSKCKLSALKSTTPPHPLLQQVLRQIRHLQRPRLDVLVSKQSECGAQADIRRLSVYKYIMHMLTMACLRTDTRIQYCVLLLKLYSCWTKPKLLHNSVHFLDVIKVPANHPCKICIFDSSHIHRT